MTAIREADIGIQLYIKNETCPKKRNLKKMFYECHVTKNEPCERTAWIPMEAEDWGGGTFAISVSLTDLSKIG